MLEISKKNYLVIHQGRHFLSNLPLQGEGLSTNAQAFHAVEFADKTVHNMGGSIDQRTGRVNLPGTHWAKFGEFSKNIIRRTAKRRYVVWRMLFLLLFSVHKQISPNHVLPFLADLA